MFIVRVQIRQCTYFTSAYILSTIQMMINDDTCTNTGSYSNPHHIDISLPRTEFLFAQRKTVGIIINSHLYFKPIFQNGL